MTDVTNWYAGVINNSGVFDETGTNNYPDSKYTDPIYIQGDADYTKKYTVNAPGLTDFSGARVRIQYDEPTFADNNIFTGSASTKEWKFNVKGNGHIELMIFKNLGAVELPNVTLTRDTSKEIEENMDIVIPKGSTLNRHYEAVWEEEVSP